MEALPEPELEVQPGAPAAPDEPAAPGEPGAALRQDPLSVLAQAAGFTDFERWWETLVEARGDGQNADAEVFGAVAEVMEAVREDGETGPRDALREAQMRQVLREALKGGGPVAVVCGAWHAPALTEAVLEREKKADPARLKGLPKIKTALTWVPWTHGRLTMASGYGAGIQSPGWYAHLFAGRPDVSAEWLTRSARMLREHKLDASSAQVIDAVRLGEALAAIRGLGLPGLPEMNDATQAVFGWDSPLPLRLLHERLVVGETLGHVPEGVPSVPLAQDLAATQKRLRLKPEATSKEVTLDLREETDLARSVLLHRLTLLNIPWGARTEVRGTGTFKEGWTLRWEPEFAVRVVEASLYGNTLVRAANVRVSGLARQAGSLSELSGLLEVCRLSQLPDAARVTLQALDARAAAAPDVAELLGALPPLARLARYGDVRTREGEDPTPVFRRLALRAGAGLPNASRGLADAAAEVIQQAVSRADAAVRLLADEQATGDWLGALHALGDTEQAHPLVQGDAVRRLRDHGELNAEAVQARMALALSPARPAAAVSAWLDGVLGQDGALLLDDPALLALLDAWVVSLPEEAFGTVLPALRRSLSRFEVAQRREMGERVRGLERQETLRPTDDALGLLPLPFALKLLGVNS